MSVDGRVHNGRPRGQSSYVHVGKKPAKTSSRIVRDLFDLIDDASLSASTVGEKAGVHPVTLSYWKHGKNTPRLSDFENVASVLGHRLVLQPVEKRNVSASD
jgi:hypothetical protein